MRVWYLLQGFEQVYKAYQESIENNNNTHIIFSIYESEYKEDKLCYM